MNESTTLVTFTLDEVNQILNRLGEIPAKYSLDLISFIRAKAQEQVSAAQQPSDVTDVVVE